MQKKSRKCHTEKKEEGKGLKMLTDLKIFPCQVEEVKESAVIGLLFIYSGEGLASMNTKKGREIA